MSNNIKIDNVKDINDYRYQYDNSIENSEAFWSHIAKRITWYKKWEKVSVTYTPTMLSKLRKIEYTLHEESN